MNDPIQYVGDHFLVGVDERTHPRYLKPGYVAQAKNYRFRQGKAVPRRGMQICRWLPTDGETPWTEVYGWTKFYDATDDLEWIVVAADSGVYRTRPNNVATAVSLPAGVTLSAETFEDFLPCMNVLLLLRGDDEDPLVCTDLDDGFKVVTQTPSGSGTLPLPRSSTGIYLQNRAWVKSGRDTVAASDILDYTRYILPNDLKFNQGDNDALVALYAFNEDTIIALKDQSIWSVTNLSGDTLSPRLRAITRQYGCVARHSVVQAGRDLFWWSEQGVMSLSLTEDNNVHSSAVALSDPLERTLRRLNPLHVDKIQAAVDPVEGDVIFALPLDDAELLGDDLVVGQHGSSAAYDSGITLVDPFYAGVLDSLLISESGSGVVAGETYRYIQGSSNDQYLEDLSTGEIYRGDTVFTYGGGAAGVRIYGVPDEAVAATLKQVKATGVCNAAIVYDTVNRAWAGVWEGDSIKVKRFMRFTVRGQERLLFITPDGEIRLWEEDIEDEVFGTVATPYADVIVIGKNGGTILNVTVQVNSGDTLTYQDSVANGFNQIGATGGSIPWGSASLWESPAGGPYGYNPSLASAWSAPNTTPSEIHQGVRFTATNGVVPSVTIGGGGDPDAIYVDSHSGTEIQPQQIETYLESRAYGGDGVQFRQSGHGYVHLSTWNPTFSITVQKDGVGESKAVATDVTRSRTTYANGTTWTDSNANDDHGTKGRQDYSVLYPATGFSLGAAGVVLERHQDMLKAFSYDVQHGAWYQVIVRNTQGRCEVHGIRLEVTGDQAASQSYLTS